MQYNHKKARIGVLTGVLALNMANFASAEPSLERGTYLVEGPAACGNCHTSQGPDGQHSNTQRNSTK